MLISRCLPLFLLLALLTLAAPAVAKGPVDNITIQGPGLAQPIEITDQEILNRFDPWAGQFIGTGGPLEGPPDVGLRVPYQVFFYLRENHADLQLRYMFYYYPDPAGGRGLIYLPGPGEPYYRINIGTIIRGESDGRWFHAMPTWDAAVQDLLPEQSLPPDDSTLATPKPILWLAAILGLALVGGIALLVHTR